MTNYQEVIKEARDVIGKYCKAFWKDVSNAGICRTGRCCKFTLWRKI